MSSSKHTTMSGSFPQGHSPGHAKLTPELEHQLAERLSTQSAQRHEAHLDKLKAGVLAEELAKRRCAKLSGEEQEDSVDRLYKQSMTKKAMTQKQIEEKYIVNPVKHTSKISKDQMQASVDKLYTQGMSHKEQSQQQLESKYLPEPSSKKLDADVLAESVQRLCGEAKQKDNKIAALRKKYWVDPPASHKAKIEAEQLKASAERLSTVPRDRADWPVSVSAESRAKLEAKYLADSMPSFAKRSAEEWTATASRLSNRG